MLQKQRLQAHNIVESMQEYEEMDPSRGPMVKKPEAQATGQSGKARKVASKKMITVRVVDKLSS